MIPIIWYGGREKWDQDVLSLVCPPDNYSTTQTGDGAVVVIPAFDYLDSVPAINAFLNKLKWCVVVLTSDEASKFPVHQLHHPNMRIWIQSPRPDIHKDKFGYRYLPLGAPSFDHSTLPLQPPDQSGIYFEGQVTHARREEMVEAFPSAITSPGFTLGSDRGTYLQRLSGAIVAPCPSGPCTPETFRFWEALEMGAVPIVDTGPRQDDRGRAVAGYPDGFWSLLLGNLVRHIPIVDRWDEAPGWTEHLMALYPVANNQASAAYQFYKRQLRLRMLDDVGAVGGNWAGPVGSNITCLIPTSPTPNNPDTSHLDFTIDAIRDQLPNSEILLMIDGIHDQQSHLKDAYQEYVRRILWKANHHWSNTVPILFDDYLHQSGKLIRTLPHVYTDFILWNEHDTPLEGIIDWGACIEELASDRLDLIRFYHEAHIHPEHEHLMRGRHGDLFMKTVQQSGRPHLARTDYYRRIMADHFSADTCTFVEFVMHSVCQCEDIEPWEHHRMALYAPDDGEPIKRSGHTDARGEEPTYEETLRT